MNPSFCFWFCRVRLTVNTPFWLYRSRGLSTGLPGTGRRGQSVCPEAVIAHKSNGRTTRKIARIVDSLKTITLQDFHVNAVIKLSEWPRRKHLNRKQPVTGVVGDGRVWRFRQRASAACGTHFKNSNG